MKTEIYADIICPWCYIGEKRLEQALDALPSGADDVEIVYRAFQLDPDAPTTPHPMHEYLSRKFGPRAGAMLQHVAELARAEGLPFEPATQMVVNTLSAHRLLRHVLLENGPAVQRDVMGRLFRAHFAGGANVGDVDVLIGIAAAAGVEPLRARAALQRDSGLRAVLDDIAAARDLGVRAVPTFVFADGVSVQGAQSVETFAAALKKTAAITMV